ncbi:PrpF domain-containing protein [Bradyrhizobium sp. Ai1a-2]|uniref:2-methylaconitate cis-trans isomerase PrpF family protein n=1 Tax=Bradyrhizobium sp. Ai1a-2 TaxID=196490 RepID=UPI0003FCC3F8|nr:PrpF domain-containing protein [Bradyrhizobium sp. Ai1a-2]
MAELPDQIAIRCTILRGGTSKGVYLLEQDIPPAGAQRDRLLKRIMGTPDILQIDGLGGSRLITSKMAIIKRSARPDADVDYTYAQVVLERDLIVYSSNCGNISSGVGPFAIDAGLVPLSEPVTRVRIHNTNTGKILIADVPVAGGRAKVTGDFAIDGVPGTGAEIRMDYTATIGAKTGKIQPTGQVTDVIELESDRRIEVTICDVANPAVFVRSGDIGLDGSELPEAFASDPALVDQLREIRGKAAQKIGFCRDWRAVDQQSPALPLVILVAEPAAYRTMRGGHTVNPDDIDLRARMVWYNRCHESMAGTGSMCIAAASRIPGSIVNRTIGPIAAQTDELRIGHPMGVMKVNVQASPANVPSGVAFKALGFSRTARRIMDGFVYVPREMLIQESA